MSNDRELLELAATAAGNGAQWDNPERGMMVLSTSGFDVDRWNPLIDDGDALRLLVRLVTQGHDIRLFMYKDHVALYAPEDAFLSKYLDDPCAATRRAIVRAAAEIGRAMK